VSDVRQATVAAMPNAHSHAFQRDLRGLGERTPDDFWSWRTQMMHLAQALDPETMHRVASTVYSEMLEAGYGAVGEFHYVHHRPDGTPYDEPNALAIAMAQAANEVGLRIVLIPAARRSSLRPDGASTATTASRPNPSTVRATASTSPGS